MNLPVTSESRARVAEFQRKHRTGVVTLLFTDIVGSTRLKQDLGDAKGISLIQGHHALVHQTLAQFGEAEEISSAGDSFFVVFVKPSDAVRFALLLQSRLRALAVETGVAVQDRIGIHIGEVFIEESEARKDLFGIQVDTAARINALARGEQILLSRFAFDNARQVLKGQDLEGIGPLSWMNHGPYLLKGVEEPLEICEVGEAPRARLSPPPTTEKARRISSDGDLVLGWRPAVGQTVPNTQWTLERKLGEGGFGEVWLGRHEKLKEQRVFKFCFRADRVRSLKREVTLFRLLKERVGAHPNIVAVQEVYLEAPPYYLIMDYAQGEDLASWCAKRGGAGKVPLATRLELVAQVADALQAAHSAGVIHRDVKPSNVIVVELPGSSVPVAKLTDFGIGQVVSEDVLAGMTRMGFTQTATPEGTTGTQMYMAPELFARRPASAGSDIYALGVVLYQLLLDDFARPVTVDWTKRVHDSLLQEDLAGCFAGDSSDRFPSAGDLAKSLRQMERRCGVRAAQERQAEEKKRSARLAELSKKIGVLVIASIAILLAIINLSKGRRYGAVGIQTSPEGVEVWLKGSLIGKTPYVDADVVPGEYTYRLSLANYEPREQKVTVARGTTRIVSAIMDPLAGSAGAQFSLTNKSNLILSGADATGAKVTEIMGRLEFARAGTTNWMAVKTNQIFDIGDRVRTGKDSYATFRLLPKGEMLLGENSLATISLPSQAGGRPVLELLKGSYYFFSRERAIQIDLTNRLVSAKVRG